MSFATNMILDYNRKRERGEQMAESVHTSLPIECCAEENPPTSFSNSRAAPQAIEHIGS